MSDVAGILVTITCSNALLSFFIFFYLYFLISRVKVKFPVALTRYANNINNDNNNNNNNNKV